MRQTAFARTLLQRQTTPEEILWRELRGRRFHGVKFRRRVPVMGAIADFLCHSTKLIVEMNGRQHRIEAEYDEKRTRDLEAAGFMVVRVTNEDVRERLDAVLERIGAALRLVRGA